MIKNKSRKELIEYAYKLSMERDKLIDCLAIQDIIINDVSGLMSKKHPWYLKILMFITLPIRLNNKIKQHSSYFYMYNNNKMRKLTEKEILKSLESINQYEGRSLNSSDYKEWIVEITGWKICNDCGSAIEMSHTNFQREVHAQVKEHYPHLAQPISFTSGKYKKQPTSDHYGDLIPFAPFNALRTTLKVMRRDYTYAPKRHPVNKQLIADDIKILENYIKSKTITEVPKTASHEMDTITSEIKALKIKEDLKPIKVKEVETVIKEVEKASVEVVEIPEIVKVQEKVEVVKSPVSDVKIVNELTDELLVKASKMKANGSHLRTIASTLNVKYKGLSAEIKAFDSVNIVEIKAVETGYETTKNDGSGNARTATYSAKSNEVSL